MINLKDIYHVEKNIYIFVTKIFASKDNWISDP